jgi:ribose transport system permease protein
VNEIGKELGAPTMADQKQSIKMKTVFENGVEIFKAQGANLLAEYAPAATLALLVIVVASINSNFLSILNLTNMLGQWAPTGIIAAGLTYVALTGGFDLSVAAAFSFTAVVVAVLGQSIDPTLAFLGGILAGIMFGGLNGFLIAVLKLNPYITTVGTGFMLNGLALLLTNNAAISVDTDGFELLGTGRFFGIPFAGILLICTYIVLEFVLQRTPYGASIYAVGGNYEAAWLSGIRVRLVTASSYILFGACAGIAGCITTSQLQSAQANLDPGMIFDVLTIVVVGGTSLAGGTGSIGKTAIGLGIVATMSNGFVLLGISPYYQDMIKGGIIVLALTMSSALTRK